MILVPTLERGDEEEIIFQKSQFFVILSIHY